MAEILLPSLGSDMEGATLVAFRRAPGDRVARGDIVAEVETDKGILDVEAYEAGVLERFVAEPGQRVRVGEPIALLRVDGEVASGAAPVVPEPTATPSAGAPVAPASATPAAVAAVAAVEQEREPPRASPLARRRAHELDVDLTTLQGTGRHGTISVEDVERAAAARSSAEAAQAPAAPAPAAKAAEPPEADARARMRRVIAATMERSKREIPHFYLSSTLDLEPALTWLEARNRAASVEERVLPAALFVKAVARAARAIPEANARWTGERVELVGDVHVAMAISLRGGGLVAPAVHHVDRLSLAELMASLGDVASRARGGRLRASEMTDGTIAVTSLGDRGVESVLPIVFPPQVAMIGFGKVVQRPWVVDGAVVPRRVVTVTLAADHRVLDGHRGGLFLEALEAYLTKPEDP